LPLNFNLTGQNENTRAFYNTYHQDLVDEDDEFKHLREDVVMGEDDAQADEPEERETVSVDEVRQRLREVAQDNTVST
jgi:mediator of replication checkpoint protein 1